MLFLLCLVFHPLFMFPPSPIASLKQWNHHMNHNYTYNIYLCWRSISSQQNFETEKLAEFCETKEVYVETKTSPGTWRESGIAESSHLSGALIFFLRGALIYFFEWSSYLFFWVELLFIFLSGALIYEIFWWQGDTKWQRKYTILSCLTNILIALLVSTTKK